MNNELQPVRPQPPVEFTPKHIELIKKTMAEGATDLELELFITQCKRTGLDPITRQIYFIKNKRDGKIQIQTSVDGFRLVAERSGAYEGQTKAEWCGSDGVWKDIWLSKEPPAAARVGVYKKGFREALYATAVFDEYAQRKKFDDRDGNFKKGDLEFMWAKMPALMIAKVAESLALRKAFPNDLSGLYSAEEMAQAENPKPETKQEVKSFKQPTGTSALIGGGTTSKNTTQGDRYTTQPTGGPTTSHKDVTDAEFKHTSQPESPPANTTNGRSAEPFTPDDNTHDANETEYRVPFGKKYKGQTLYGMGPTNVKSYRDYIVSEAKKQNKELQGQGLEFVNNANEFLAYNG